MKLCSACRRHVRPGAGACPFCGEVLRTTASAGLGAAVLLGALGSSCASRPVEETATDVGTASDTSTTTGTTSTSTTTLPDPTTSTSSSTTTAANSSTGELSTTNDIDTTDQGCSFYGGCPTDFADPKQCDPWTQDCPPGEKCMPYSDDGDNSLESLKCVPVMENPGQAGEPCTVEGGGISGVDSCDLGHLCWDVDPNTGEGTCLKFCTGSPDQPMCDPGFACTNGETLIVCLPICDPLVQDCPASDVCIPNPQGESFVCAPDVSGEEGQEFDACEWANGCDPGHVCLSPDAASECDPMAVGCCIAFCDLSMPTCNGQNAECLPWYEMGNAPPGEENVGICVIPQ